MCVCYLIIGQACLIPLDWNEDCFRSHIRNAHDSSILSDHTIRLLWRSFSYYACHPFSRGDIDRTRVDESAFLRAVLLLALQANDLLGTQEGDWFWRNDDEYFHRKSWERMLRSIARPCAVTVGEERGERDAREAMVSDIMDVLSMTQPQPGLPNSSSPEQLEPAARRFDADEDRGAKFIAGATSANLQGLVEVSMRLRLGHEKWGRFFHMGSLCASPDRGAELAKMLANQPFSPGRNGEGEDDILTSDNITKLMDRLPNLHLRFLQLWSIIFQPQAQTSEIMTEQETTGNVVSLEALLGALSLFVPQAATLTRYGERLTMQDTRIAFAETSTYSTVENTALPLTHFVRLLSEKANQSDVKSPYIVLFTNSDTTSNQRTSTSHPVLGAYFPSPLFRIDEEVGEMLYSLGTGSSSDSTLFQLWPELRVVGWRRGGLALEETLNSASIAQTVAFTELSPARIAMECSSNEENALSNIAYWIGRRRSDSDVNENNRTGLHVNPTKQTVTLSLKTYPEKKSGFEQVSRSSSGETCEITVSSAIMHVFTVSGGAIVGKKKGEPVVQDLSRYTRDELAPRLDGQELKARIEGFGPN